MESVKSEIKLITPDLAQKILDSQIKNRKWRRDFIDRYKSAMIADQWFLNGEPIIIDEKGALIDGQHRLRALIEANKSVQMVVTTGVKSGLEKTIDMGKSRSVGDIFQMQGIRNARLLSRTSKLLLVWNEKFDEIVLKKAFSREIMNVHPQTVYDFYKEHIQEIDRACSEFKKYTPVIVNTGSAVLSFVFYVLEKINSSACYDFITSYVGGNIKKEWPHMKTIRGQFENHMPTGKIRITEGERISILFGIWNVVYHGESIEKVENTPLNIPLELLK